MDNVYVVLKALGVPGGVPGPICVVGGSEEMDLSVGVMGLSPTGATSLALRGIKGQGVFSIGQNNVIGINNEKAIRMKRKCDVRKRESVMNTSQRWCGRSVTK